MQPEGRSEQDGLRGLERGLSVLEFLNLRDNQSVAAIARGVGLPRTTVIRILATLQRLGFVTRDRDRRGYRLAIRVRALADGYDDESWVADIARPRVERLGAELVFPVLLATPLGSSMLWRVATDRDSPLAVHRYGVGLRTPLTESATGYVYLAWCSAAQRAAALDVVATLSQYARRGVFQRERIERDVARVRARGHALLTRPLGRETALSVPVLAGGSYLASLAVRYPRGAFGEGEAVKRFLAPLRTTAEAIGREFAQAAGRRRG